MIFETICTLFFSVMRGFIALISVPLNIPAWIADAANLVGIGLLIFPIDVWAFCIGSVVFWTGIQFTWAIIEWIYKKIPGVS